jgi:DNA repair protein RadA/Sms
MRSRSKYVCQQCGYESTGWLGKCPQCASWNSLVETVVSTPKTRKLQTSKTPSKKPVSISSISSKRTSRLSTKISELDRVLGGGLVSGQVVLLAGEPGIGKSTLLLQVAQKLGNVLYISGEESIRQLKIRADRLGVSKKTIQVVEETNTDNIVFQIETLAKNGLTCVIVDSIQAVATEDLRGLTGSIGQVRESAYRLVRVAKKRNIPLFIVGQVTKEGTVAGPATLAHIVDTLLWFEGDKSLTLRLLRAVKNRFGPTDEVGIFSMEDKGLKSIDNPEKLFLTGGRRTVAGSVASSVMQGLRPIMVEVQSLVVPSKLAFPKRIAQGIDSRRLELLIAVLVRRCGLPLYEYDCFVNVAGGVVAKDLSIDLAICLSLASAFFDKALLRKSVAVGEVGLLGEIRGVMAEEKRIKEARRLGFTLPITRKQVKYLQQAIKKYLR